MKNKLSLLLIGALLFSLGFITNIARRSPPAQLGTGAIASATNSYVGVTSTPTLILSANTGRGIASVCNTPLNADIWISTFAGGTTPTTTPGATNYFASSTGRYVAPGSCYDVNQDNLFTGAIWGISRSIASTSQVVSVFEVNGY